MTDLPLSDKINEILSILRRGFRTTKDLESCDCPECKKEVARRWKAAQKK